MKNTWNWMTDDEREEAEERAAIMQYHGNATREQAEFWAVDRLLTRREQRWQQHATRHFAFLMAIACVSILSAEWLRVLSIVLGGCFPL